MKTEQQLEMEKQNKGIKNEALKFMKNVAIGCCSIWICKIVFIVIGGIVHIEAMDIAAGFVAGCFYEIFRLK